MADAPKLIADFEIRREEILVSYGLENTTGEELFVFARLYQLRDGQAEVDRRLVYTCVEDGGLALTKGVVAVPEGLQLEFAETPYAFKLPPGGKLRESFDLEVPVAYHNPNNPPQSSDTVKCRKICLRVGYALAADLPGPLESFENAKEALYRIKYHAALAAQKFVESPWVEANFSVQRTL